MAGMIVSLKCCTLFLLLPLSLLYKNIVYKSILVQNFLKLKNKLRIKLGSTFSKATKFMEKWVLKLVSFIRVLVIGS